MAKTDSEAWAKILAATQDSGHAHGEPLTARELALACVVIRSWRLTGGVELAELDLDGRQLFEGATFINLARYVTAEDVPASFSVPLVNHVDLTQALEEATSKTKAPWSHGWFQDNAPEVKRVLVMLAGTTRRLQQLGERRGIPKALLSRKTISTFIPAHDDAPADDLDAFDAAGLQYADQLREVLGGEWPQDALVDINRGVRASAAMALWDQVLGGLVSPARFAQAIVRAADEVQQLIADRRIVAMQSKNGEWHVPVWQASLPPAARQALAAAFHELVDEGRLSAWAAGAWLVNEHPDLDGLAPRTFVVDVDETSCERLVYVARGDAAAAAR